MLDVFIFFIGFTIGIGITMSYNKIIEYMYNKKKNDISSYYNESGIDKYIYENTINDGGQYASL